MADTGGVVIPGWYGKLPGVGDFVGRRLPEDFVREWDAWLQEVVATTRAGLGTGWIERYLTMPIWRFVLVSGLVAGRGWAGVLMPSVDRVGRQFPLTIAVPLESDAAFVQAVFESADWYEDVEEAALGMLDPTRGPDELERALTTCAFPLPPSPARGPATQPLRRLPSTEDFGRVAKVESLHAWTQHAGWKAVWWTRGRVGADSLMMTCAALPTADEFGKLLT
jgi:type VI secretion system protein ImpM